MWPVALVLGRFRLYLHLVIGKYMEKVYLQKLIYSGSSHTLGELKETVADFDIYLSEVPFIPVGMELKEPATRDWNDEDGVDVFYAATPRMKDYDMEISCMAKANTLNSTYDENGVLLEKGLRDIVDDFLKYLSGAEDGQGNVFAIYDTRNGAGRKNVRYLSVDPDVFYNEEGDEECFVSFKAKFHVDDPRTEVSLVYDSSGEVTSLTYTE